MNVLYNIPADAEELFYEHHIKYSKDIPSEDLGISNLEETLRQVWKINTNMLNSSSYEVKPNSTQSDFTHKYIEIRSSEKTNELKGFCIYSFDNDQAKILNIISKNLDDLIFGKLINIIIEDTNYEMGASSHPQQMLTSNCSTIKVISRKAIVSYDEFLLRNGFKHFECEENSKYKQGYILNMVGPYNQN
ncbi:Hypothetical protein HVR_LOCUS1358 [uncultured virus]|nr:Hypothetical protein HVR_LOCUS1358 [uncultured virus]